MGIRNSEIRSIPIINPPDNPFLHIESLLSGDGSYKYIPKLDGMTYHVGIFEHTAKGAQFHELSNKIEIPLLPPLETIPPDPIVTEKLLDLRIREHLEKIIYSIEDYPDANAFSLSHGRGYGLEPEHKIAQKVQNVGIAQVRGEIIKVGGRNRIQEHAVLFKRSR